MSRNATRRVEWIAADWGTSRLRAWAMDESDSVVERIESDRGMNRLRPDQFESALVEGIGKFLREGVATPVICCGMAGARQGWTEAPYLESPCSPLSPERAIRAPASDSRIEAFILPGVMRKSPPDVMRGEETQIAGFLSREPKFDGVLCLPGTHSKWVRIRSGEIAEFRSFMTGEIFALLGKESSLRHSLAGSGWDESAFLEAVAQAAEDPVGLAERFFPIRADSLLNGVSGESLRSRLSGLLVGSELVAALRWTGDLEIIVAAEGEAASAWIAALESRNAKARRIPADELTLEGLRSARKRLAQAGILTDSPSPSTPSDSPTSSALQEGNA